MSYTKQTWATGDTVTATKLNHIEDGVEGAGSYDAVISCLIPEASSDPAVFTIESGSFAALEALILDHKAPAILYKCALEAFYSDCVASSDSIITYYSNATDPKTITICIMAPFIEDGNPTMIGAYIVWDENDEIAFAD